MRARSGIRFPAPPGHRGRAKLDGRDYHFLTREEFERRLEAGDFLEHAEVHGNLYGSLKSEVLSHLAAGVDVVMDIDVQGAEQVRNCVDPDIRRSFVDLFVMPPSERGIARPLCRPWNRQRGNHLLAHGQRAG